MLKLLYEIGLYQNTYFNIRIRWQVTATSKSEKGNKYMYDHILDLYSDS